MHQKYHYLTRSNSSQSLKHTNGHLSLPEIFVSQSQKKRWTEDQRLISPYHLSRAAIKQPFCCVVIQQIFVCEVAKVFGLDRDETARGTIQIFIWRCSPTASRGAKVGTDYSSKSCRIFLKI